MVVASYPTELKPSSTEESQQFSSAISSLVIPTSPNREYTVFIETVSCAGASEKIIATGQCITDVSVPDVIPTVAKMSDLRNGRITIAMSAPDETNGPVSCVFIAVQVGEGAISDDISRLLDSSLSMGVKDTYFAVANHTFRAITKLNILLGDDETSYCDVSSSASSGRKRSTVSNVILARNRLLSDSNTYRIYMVTTTPTPTKILHQISDPLVLIQSSDSIVNIVVPAIGGTVVIVLFVTALFLRRRMANRNTNDIQVPVAYTLPPPRLEEPEYSTIDFHHQAASNLEEATVPIPFGIRPPRYTPAPIGVTLACAATTVEKARHEEGPYETPISVQPSELEEDYTEMRNADEENSNYHFAR